MMKHWLKCKPKNFKNTSQQKKNEYSNGQAGLQKKGRWKILHISLSRQNKDEVFKAVDKRLIINLLSQNKLKMCQ